jgi:CheY-like chemotaxis protein
MTLRVMIVEDEALIAMDLEFQLEDLGHSSVGIAARTGDAIDLAQRERPDLAFIDLSLACGDDGRDVAIALRDDLGIPSILLSASLHRLTAEDVDRIAPEAMLSKPIMPGTLARTLRDVARDLHLA